MIAAQETANCYPSGIVYSIGSRKCEGSIAAGLYDILREMDHLGLSISLQKVLRMIIWDRLL